MRREDVFRLLREEPSTPDPFIEIANRLKEMRVAIVSLADKMMDDVGMTPEERERIKAQAEAEFTPPPSQEKLKTILDKCQTSEYRAKRIEESKREVFPHVIDFHLLELLKERMEAEGVEAAYTLLNHIKLHGVSIVWETIAPNVRKDTKRMCGTSFPEAAIEEGRTLILDLNALTEDFILASTLKEHGPDFKRFLEQTEGSAKATAMLDAIDPSLKKYLEEAPVRTGEAVSIVSTTPAPKPNPPAARAEAPYFPGLRRGFLDNKSPVSRSHPKSAVEKEEAASSPGSSFK